MAALGGRVAVRNLDPASAQGDRRFVGALAAMGCRVSAGPDGVTVEHAILPAYPPQAPDVSYGDSDASGTDCGR